MKKLSANAKWNMLAVLCVVPWLALVFIPPTARVTSSRPPLKEMILAEVLFHVWVPIPAIFGLLLGIHSMRSRRVIRSQKLHLGIGLAIVAIIMVIAFAAHRLSP